MSIDYTIQYNKPVIFLFARDEDGKREVFKNESFKPYFYAPINEVVNNDGVAKALWRNPKTREVKIIDVGKIVMNIPSEVRKNRDNFSMSFESDILFPTRFLIDKEIFTSFEIVNGCITPCEDFHVPMKVLYVDIEVETRDNEFPEPMLAKFPIITIVVNVDDEYYKLYGNEAEMLKEFVKIVQKHDPDVITGYNVWFDLITVIKRMEKLKLDYNDLSPMGYVNIRERFGQHFVIIHGRNAFDMYDAIKKYFFGKTFDSYKLEDIVCNEEVGLKMPYHPFDRSKVNKENLENVLVHNIEDVERLVALDKHLNLINHFDGVRHIAGCKLDETLTTNLYADVLLLRLYKGRYVLQKKERRERVKFKGGHVKQPKKGVFEDVVVMDFSQMYPSAIISNNMSPETLVDGDDERDKYHVGEVYFLKEPKGIVPQAFEQMAKYRKELKMRMKGELSEEEYRILDLRQYGLKSVINAMYGLMAYKGSRLYYPEVSAGTTFFGRKLIAEAIDYAEVEEDYVVLYCDTDSLLISTGGDPIVRGKELAINLNEFFRDMADELGLKLIPNIEFEMAYKTLLFSGKKKRYAGLCIYDKGKTTDKIRIRGFEARRSDSSRISRKAQREIMEMILRGKKEPEIRSYVKSLVGQIKKLPIREIGIPEPLGMAPEEYKVPAQILGVLVANKYLDKVYNKGDKPYTLWLRTTPEGVPRKIKVDGKLKDVTRVALDEGDDLDFWRHYVDWDLQIEKIIKKKIDPILNAFGLSFGEVMSGTKQMRLGDYGHN